MQSSWIWNTLPHHHYHRQQPRGSCVSQTEFGPPLTPPLAFLVEEKLGRFISNSTTLPESTRLARRPGPLNRRRRRRPHQSGYPFHSRAVAQRGPEASDTPLMPPQTMRLVHAEVAGDCEISTSAFPSTARMENRWESEFRDSHLSFGSPSALPLRSNLCFLGARNGSEKWIDKGTARSWRCQKYSSFWLYWRR